MQRQADDSDGDGDDVGDDGDVCDDGDDDDDVGEGVVVLLMGSSS